MAIIGEELEGYVQNQINARQTLHGSGVGHTGTLRTDKQINLLNSNTSWIKLASGVSISGSNRLTEIGLPTNLIGMGLAKNNILFSGISKISSQTVNGESYTQLEQREGFLPRDANSSYTYGSFGFSPMPGIISADIKTLTRGSLKRATVKLTANNKQQFDIIDLLYMRLGYTVLLEWGNSIYTTNGGDKEILRNTLIEDMFFNTESNGSYLEMLEPIANKREEYSGNYDALLGKVSNFNWSFNTDGSYDIELTIISLGDVIESLKSNLSVDSKTQEFFNDLTKSTPDSATADPPEETIDEEETQTDIITAALAIYKFINNKSDNRETRPLNITTSEVSDPYHWVGNFLYNTQEGESADTVKIGTITYEYTVTFKVEKIENIRAQLSTGVTSEERIELEESIQKFEMRKGDRFTKQKTYTNDPETLSEEAKKYREELEKLAISKGAMGTVADGDIRITSQKKKSDKGGIKTITNPLSEFSSKDAFRLNDKGKNHYLRFGALLEFLVDNIIPTTTDSDLTPMFKIDVDPWYNYMYSLPNQISLDPRVCLVRNSQFNTYKKGNTKILNEIPYFFKEIDNPNSINKSENSAYPLNIYLNFNFILECLKSDEKGNVSVYELISNICTGLNKALGGINNLEPIIDEETITLRIIDTTPIPGHSAAANFKGYVLQIYGYDKVVNNYISNFVRKVDLKTVIDPGFATMITVGATAGGYVKGTEATAFSKWNTGLVDRFKEKFIPPTKNNETAKTDEDDPAIMYKEEFAGPKGFSSRYGWTSLNSNFKFSDNFIEKNISTVTEYYKWLIAKNAEGKDVSGGTVGFIPFKLGLTLDGISGIKIYNVLRVNTEFLPKAYGKSVDLIVTGVSHRLNNSDWETSIEATVMPKTGEMALVAITAEQAETILSNTTTQGYPVSPGDLKLVEKAGGIAPYILLPDGTIKVKTWPSTLRPGDSGYNPKARHWFEPNPDYPLVSVKIPYANGEKSIQVHKDLASKIEKAAKTIKNNNLQKYIKTVDGGFALRNVTNGKRLSNHAFGFAVDLNISQPGCGWDQGFILANTKGKCMIKTPSGKKKMGNQEFGYWKVARAFGFEGIGWYYTIDAMHFSIYEGISSNIPEIPNT